MLNKKNTLSFFQVLACCLLLSGTAFSSEDPNTMAKQIYKDLSQAERLMYNGKKEEADAQLQEVNTALVQLKTSAPDHKNLGSLEKKYSKIRTTLDKRMKKSAPGSSASATPTGTSPSRSTAPGSTSKKTSSNTVTSKSSSSTAPTKKSSSASSVDANKLVRDIDMQLKKAERMVRAGKDERSKPYLDKAEQMIEELKAADAANAQIAGLEQRYNTMASTGADKEQATAGLQQDARTIVAIYDEYSGEFEKIHGDHFVQDYLDLKQVEAALKVLEEAEQTIPLFSSDLAPLMEKYGRRSMDIYNAFFKAGYKLPNGEEHKMEFMVNAVTNVQESREATGRHLADKAKMLVDVFSDQLNDARLERMQKSKKLLALGQQIDPNNQQIKEMYAKIDDQITQASDQMAAQIDAATWTESISGFPGPGTVEQLAAQAKTYFENDRDWGGRSGRNMEILKVSVTGPWKVADTDAFGRVTRWRLPIHLAITDDKFKPRNIARVYDLSIVAMEGAPASAPKKPPFDGFWVGDNWMMRLDKF